MTSEDNDTKNQIPQAYDAKPDVSAEGLFPNKREWKIVTRNLDLSAKNGRLTLLQNGNVKNGKEDATALAFSCHELYAWEELIE